MTLLSDAFIKEYQDGKYGYGVRGEEKALMYSRAIHMKTEKEIWFLRQTCEVDLRHGGNIGWVSKSGYILFCDLASHSAVANHLFLQLEEEFEKDWAKVTETTKSVDDAIRYVIKPTKLQKRYVEELLYGSDDDAMVKRFNLSGDL